MLVKMGPRASFTGDGAYDRDRVYQAMAEHQPDAAVIVPVRAGRVLIKTGNKMLGFGRPEYFRIA